MPLPHDDRRSEPRYRFPIPVRVYLLFPEETFSIREAAGVSADISTSGCRLRVDELDKQVYVMLLRAVRHTKLVFDFGDRGPIEVRGRIVWLDYHDSRRGEKSHCFLGVHFEKTPDNYREAIEALVAGAETGQQVQ